MTGYTSALVDKKLTFPEFAMRCARAFGIGVRMRDEPSDKPLPDRFEPNPYHLERLQEAKKELTELLGEDPEAWARRKIAEEIAVNKNSLPANNNKDVFEKMLAEVRNWTPPTPDHQGIKDFMVQQLADSVKSESDDYYTQRIAELETADPKQYYEKRVELAKQDIEYHEDKWRQELEYVQTSNRWLKQLRESLGHAG